MKQVVFNVTKQAWEFYKDMKLVKTLPSSQVGSDAQKILESL